MANNFKYLFGRIFPDRYEWSGWWRKNWSKGVADHLFCSDFAPQDNGRLFLRCTQQNWQISCTRVRTLFVTLTDFRIVIRWFCYQKKKWNYI